MKLKISFTAAFESSTIKASALVGGMIYKITPSGMDPAVLEVLDFQNKFARSPRTEKVFES